MVGLHRETNETYGGKLDKETNGEAIDVATLVTLVLDEDILIKAHKNVLRGRKENRDNETLVSKICCQC